MQIMPFLLRKKDGSMCMCIDFHTLNANTHVDWFPIPHIDDLLDQLHGVHVFLKIDLRAGYHYI